MFAGRNNTACFVNLVSKCCVSIPTPVYLLSVYLMLHCVYVFSSIGGGNSLNQGQFQASIYCSCQSYLCGVVLLICSQVAIKMNWQMKSCICSYTYYFIQSCLQTKFFMHPCNLGKKQGLDLGNWCLITKDISCCCHNQMAQGSKL